MADTNEIDREQRAFGQAQLRAEQQSEADRAEIKVKLIENGILVKSGSGWYTFTSWNAASAYIEGKIMNLRAGRKPRR